MKLLYVITRAVYGGAQAHVLDLLRGAASRFTVALATGEDGTLADRARQMGIPVFLVPQMVAPVAPMDDALALVSLIRVMRAFRPDLVHAHSSKAGMLSRIAARISGAVSVFTAHGWSFADGLPRIRRWFAQACERAALPFLDAIIAVSRYDHDLAVHCGIVPRAGIHCIRNGIADHASRANPAQPGIPTLAMVARFCGQKDHLTLVRALAGIKQNFRVIFVGDGPTLNRIRSEVLALGLAGCVQFLGERDDVADLLAGVQLFVLSSHYEGLPISILEAMRAGLPVVANRVGGVPELVQHGVNGLLTAPRNICELRDHCVTLLSNPAARVRMGNAGRRLYERHFTLDQMLKQTFCLYDAVLAQSACLSEVPEIRYHSVPS